MNTKRTLSLTACVLAVLLAACSIASAVNYLEDAVITAKTEAPIIEQAYNVSAATGAKVNAYFTAVAGCLGAAQAAEAVPGATPGSIGIATAGLCSTDLLAIPNLGTGVPAEILTGIGLVAGAVNLYLTSLHSTTAELASHPEFSQSFAGKQTVKAWKHANAKQLSRIKTKLAELKAKLR